MSRVGARLCPRACLPSCAWASEQCLAQHACGSAAGWLRCRAHSQLPRSSRLSAPPRLGRRPRRQHALLAGQPAGAAGARAQGCRAAGLHTGRGHAPSCGRAADALARGPCQACELPAPAPWAHGTHNRASLPAPAAYQTRIRAHARPAGRGARRARGVDLDRGLAPGGAPAGHGRRRLCGQVLVQVGGGRVRTRAGLAGLADGGADVFEQSRCRDLLLLQCTLLYKGVGGRTASKQHPSLRPPPPSAPRRCRPGDPFFDAQQEEQRELAALAAEAEPVAAPRPASLAGPAPTFGTTGAGGAIPGIGDAVAMPTLPQATAAAFDVFSIRQQPYDERGGRPPADGGPAAAPQRPGGRDDDRCAGLWWMQGCCSELQAGASWVADSMLRHMAAPAGRISPSPPPASPPCPPRHAAGGASARGRQRETASGGAAAPLPHGTRTRSSSTRSSPGSHARRHPSPCLQAAAAPEQPSSLSRNGKAEAGRRPLLQARRPSEEARRRPAAAAPCLPLAGAEGRRRLGRQGVAARRRLRGAAAAAAGAGSWCTPFL